MIRSSKPRAPVPADTDLAGFARRVVVAVLISVLILALAYGLWRGLHILLLAFGGVLFALFLSALSDCLSERTGMRYGWALVCSRRRFILGLRFNELAVGEPLGHSAWAVFA